MATNADAYTPIGDALLYFGDPTAGSGAMKDLGKSENVAFNPGQRVTWGSDAALNGVPDSDKLYDQTPAATVTADLVDQGVTSLNNIIYNSTVTSAAVGGGSAFAKQTTKKTLFVLPRTQVSSGVAAANGIWLPSCIAQVGNAAGYTRPTVNGETITTFDVTFTAAYVESDQTSPTPVSIPANARIWFMGDPSDLSLTWSIA